MAKAKLHVKKGDLVQVISGKDRGKEGEVLKAFPSEGKVIVEEINIVNKHIRPSQDNPQGGIVEQEAAVDSSNVMLICPSCKQKSRTGTKFLDSGEKVRFCKKCDEIVD